MDGMELSHFLHDNYPDVLIVIFSGFGEFEYAKKAIQYNVSEYMLKPVTAMELTKVIENMKEKLDSRHFQITGLKGFIDGVTETYTGLLLEPYTDRPDTCGEKLPLWPRTKMQEEITAANEAGIQVRLHCIADGSVRMALDMYEEAEKRTGRKDLRNTIEHIENIHPDDTFCNLIIYMFHCCLDTFSSISHPSIS